MKKELVFIQSCPNEIFYTWQVHLWLESLKEIGHSNKAISLIYQSKLSEHTKLWDNLIKLYPEAKFYFYNGNNTITNLTKYYAPIIRPYCLREFFKEFPEMEQKAIFYCDSDIIFNNNFDIGPFIDDDTNYLSDTFSYISASYFDSKIKDVLIEKREEYQKIDVLNDTCQLVGISRDIAEKYDKESGGAQYLLKNINFAFWDKVLIDCMKILLHLRSLNQTYFLNENKGFQSYCSDMWAVLWNLWYNKAETKVIPEMEFAWSSDSIERTTRPNVGILHNAGITSNWLPEIKKPNGDIHRPPVPVFNKLEYRGGKSPFSDPHLEKVHNNEYSKKLANWVYVLKMMELKQKYNLN